MRRASQLTALTTTATTRAIRSPLSLFSGHRPSLFSSSAAAATSNSMEEEEDDAFQIFGLPRNFDIDETELKNAYRQLMTELHPDKQKHAVAATTVSSTTTTASDVTRAYDRLRDKHSRAAHLLELLGCPLEESSTGSFVGNAFLMRIMELREEVDEADSDEQLQPLWKENEARIDQTCDELGKAIDRGDFDEAQKLTAQLQYWNRISETIRGKMDTFEE